MKFSLLADNPQAADTVAQWYFDEWASSVPGTTVDDVKRKVAQSTRRHTAPMVVLASEHDVVIGAGELKLHEMDIFPEYQYWLGGIYVDRGRRGNGIGSLLVKQIIDRAIRAGIDTLYLQTESLAGGIYAKLGFCPVKEVNYNGYDVLVMRAEISG
jgi:GNAT superfamily N-acetyltransferase